MAYRGGAALLCSVFGALNTLNFVIANGNGKTSGQSGEDQ